MSATNLFHHRHLCSISHNRNVSCFDTFNIKQFIKILGPFFYVHHHFQTTVILVFHFTSLISSPYGGVSINFTLGLWGGTWKLLLHFFPDHLFDLFTIVTQRPTYFAIASPLPPFTLASQHLFSLCSCHSHHQTLLNIFQMLFSSAAPRVWYFSFTIRSPSVVLANTSQITLFLHISSTHSLNVSSKLMPIRFGPVYISRRQISRERD